MAAGLQVPPADMLLQRVELAGREPTPRVAGAGVGRVEAAAVVATRVVVAVQAAVAAVEGAIIERLASEVRT